MQRFRDRAAAGRVLADLLKEYANRSDVIVLALPRGGVPVAFEVARALRVPLDVLIVRKLGVPGHEELALGAIASGGVRVLNEDVLSHLDIADDIVDAVAEKELRELERREQLYRLGRAAPILHGRIVILVDDGLATGSTMHAAVKAMRQQGPAQIIVAVPAASPETCRSFAHRVDKCICAITPEFFYAVGMWYDDFAPVSDEEVSTLLQTAYETATNHHSQR